MRGVIAKRLRRQASIAANQDQRFLALNDPSRVRTLVRWARELKRRFKRTLMYRGSGKCETRTKPIVWSFRDRENHYGRRSLSITGVAVSVNGRAFKSGRWRPMWNR